MIDDLEAKAKAATPGPWGRLDDMVGPNVPGLFQPIAGTDVYCVKRNLDFIAAANPETVLKLIRVVRAAKEIMGGNSICDCSPVGQCAKCNLYEALAAMGE